MIAEINFSGENQSTFQIDLNKPLDISIPLDPLHQPKCFQAPDMIFDPVRSGSFVGSMKKGSPVNFFNIFLNPHGSTTHTECSGHVFDNNQYIKDTLKHSFFKAQLVSICPEETKDGDFVFGLNSIAQLQDKIEENVKALVIRSIPNAPDKRTKDYSEKNPPYLRSDFVEFIVELGIEHLLVDLPSIDKENDQGKLLGHKAFWNSDERRKGCTITELIYVETGIEDDVYLIQINTLAICLDVSPSRPVLYKINNSIKKK